MSRGRFAEAAERLRPLAALAERAADVQFIGPVQASLTELALWEGRPDDAASQVATAIRLVGFTPEVRIGEVYALGVRANADAAELARATALDRTAATRRRDRATPDRRRSAAGTRRSSPTGPVRAASPRRGCCLCEAEGDATASAARAPMPGSRSVEAWDRLGRPYLAAYARYREAEARLAAKGDRRRRDDGAPRGARDRRRDSMPRRCAPRGHGARRAGAADARAGRARSGRRAPSTGDEAPDSRPDAARAGGPRPGRLRADQSADRRRAVHQREHGRRPRLEHPGQARRQGSRRGRRAGLPARARRRGGRSARVGGGGRSRSRVGGEPPIHEEDPPCLPPAPHSPGSPPTTSRPRGRSTPARSGSR